MCVTSFTNRKDIKMTYILPFIITIIIIVSQVKRRDTYNTFIKGAGDGLLILKNIFPALLGVMTAASMLRASGALDIFIKFISPVTDFLKIPPEIMPIALLRPVSGSGSLGILTNIFKEYGPDSVIGKISSVIMGSTETTFYCISVYYAKTRVKSSSKILCIALFCDFIAVLAAVYLCR